MAAGHRECPSTSIPAFQGRDLEDLWDENISVDPVFRPQSGELRSYSGALIERESDEEILEALVALGAKA